MSRFLVVIEPTATGYSAYAPDIDGCVAAASTLEAVERAMREAVEFHVDGLRIEGLPIPRAGTLASFVEVAV